ncbi:hypothetical protein PHMEG_00035573 [Phytophthora megakarya]|uniref:Uncharacterized protein n=1 Tax=Phytophthora megakarya TaxID=4795 RepID=A0A225UNI4_9STRA|nr:hypothetical protein PHMEG_00035573 [Phytophthora megakarya]
MKRRWNTYKSKFTKTLNMKKSETGMGLTSKEIQAGLSIPAKLDKLCPHFARMHALFGEKPNVKAAATKELGAVLSDAGSACESGCGNDSDENSHDGSEANNITGSGDDECTADNDDTSDTTRNADRGYERGSGHGFRGEYRHDLQESTEAARCVAGFDTRYDVGSRGRDRRADQHVAGVNTGLLVSNVDAVEGGDQVARVHRGDTGAATGRVVRESDSSTHQAGTRVGTGWCEQGRPSDIVQHCNESIDHMDSPNFDFRFDGWSPPPSSTPPRAGQTAFFLDKV